jgi:DeoR/GlpR family transcriptional regulator of sugar metabolism
VEVKRAMIAAAREVVLVADNSKWGRVTLAQIAPLSAITTVVTDAALPPEARRAIEAAGVQVLMPVSEAPELQITPTEVRHA